MSVWVPSVSVVIPMYDAASTIDTQLEALSGQEYGGDWEVIVADNGSRDDGAERARAWADRLPVLSVVDASDARGAHHARNVGTAMSTGEVVLYCDSDDVVRPGWIEAMVEGLASADIVGGRIDTRVINDELAQAWSGPGPMAAREPRGVLRRHRGGVDFAISANCGVRREVVEAIEGWRGEFDGCEDVDFSLQAQLAGFRLGEAPDAVIDYRLRSDLRSLARTFFSYGRGSARFHEATLEAQRQLAAIQGRPGYPQDAPRDGASVGRWLLANAPRALVSATHRGIWVRTLSHAAGFFVGSVAARREERAG